MRTVDAVFYTHPHADHVHGIDDLRVAALNARRRVDVWADRSTGNMLEKRFSYCFKTPPNSDYPPILNLNILKPGETVTITSGKEVLDILPFKVEHGSIHSLGYRIGNIAYTPDINGVPDTSLEALAGLDIWIVDALRKTAHPSHFSLSDTLFWIKRLKPKRAILTNLHVDMDYRELLEELPDHIEPAYDGMVLSTDTG